MIHYIFQIKCPRIHMKENNCHTESYQTRISNKFLQLSSHKQILKINSVIQVRKWPETIKM